MQQHQTTCVTGTTVATSVSATQITKPTHRKPVVPKFVFLVFCASCRHDFEAFFGMRSERRGATETTAIQHIGLILEQRGEWREGCFPSQRCERSWWWWSVSDLSHLGGTTARAQKLAGQVLETQSVGQALLFHVPSLERAPWNARHRNRASTFATRSAVRFPRARCERQQVTGHGRHGSCDARPFYGCKA